MYKQRCCITQHNGDGKLASIKCEWLPVCRDTAVEAAAQ